MRVAIISQSFDTSSGQGVFRAAGEFATHLERAGVDVIRVDAPKMRDFVFYLKVPQLLRGTDADVYHFFMPEYALGLFLPAVRKRSIVTIHDCIPLRAPERHVAHTLWSRFTYHIAKYTKKIHAPSNFTAQDVVSLLGVPHSQVETIPWGIDLGKFSHVHRRQSHGSVEVAGYLGGFGRRKNVGWILHLAKHFPHIEFRIAGRGPLLSQLKKSAREMGLTNVRFIGFVPEKELPEFYAGLDVFLFPSQYEGFGFPVVEAIAAGVPYVIAGDTGIARELPILRVRTLTELVNVFGNVVRGDVEPIRDGWRALKEAGIDWETAIRKFINTYSRVLE